MNSQVEGEQATFGASGAATGSSSTPASSPYATGGGGVSLERRVAVLHLAALLTGGSQDMHGRRVDRVSFQQAPAHKVDDLVLHGAQDDGSDPMEVAVAVRRAPSFATSDEDTRKLVGDLLSDLPVEDGTSQASRAATVVAQRRLAVCVSGRRTPAEQVSQLAALARTQTTAQSFFNLLDTPGRFQWQLVKRLRHLVNLVAANLSSDGAGTESAHAAEDADGVGDGGDGGPGSEDGGDRDGIAEEKTWWLLRHLDILMPRVEPPDESDWDALLDRLMPWAREPTAAGAAALRDRFEALVASYAPTAAVVDLRMLRRDAHDVVNVDARRRATAWAELRLLDGDARSAVRQVLGVGEGPVLALDRRGAAESLREARELGKGALVTGESGVGKSALVLRELCGSEPPKGADGGTVTTDRGRSADPAGHQVVCLNLRHLPATAGELRALLGAPLDELLSEMSAPTRMLVLDGADSVLENDGQLLRHLLHSARAADVAPYVIAADDAVPAVSSVAAEVGVELMQVAIGGLDDDDLAKVAETYPRLRRLVAEPRSRELLRRPAVVDLFVRSGSGELPLSESDAADIVWRSLVRNDERTDRGIPDAREQVMHLLARQQLWGTDATYAFTSLNPEGLRGLQQDGLVRRHGRWSVLPAFGHDLLRTYAVSRVLLGAGDPVRELLASDAPRWALPAMRLAIQVQLAPDQGVHHHPAAFARVQGSVDRLSAEGHGERWSDLPTEALLTLPNARQLLAEAWPTLVAGTAEGLRRLLRILQQRHRRGGSVDRLVAEPIVGLLLDNGWPAALGDEVQDLLRSWLQGLILGREPTGHRLRIALRERLLDQIALGNRRIAQGHHAETEHPGFSTAEAAPADEVPPESIGDDTLELLALLGRDLGNEGAELLRRVATDAPHYLAPTLEPELAGHGVASYSSRLLIDLAEAYYIDTPQVEDYLNDGIRNHHGGPLTSQFSAYNGPFLALLRADPYSGVAFINRMVNHAARVRGGGVDIRGPVSADDLHFHADPTELAITGDIRGYFGDEQVWLWYRGTGVGPFPCISALQALEVACDEYLAAGITPAQVVRLLLDGCENLAVPALAVGVLVRHLERVDSELDLFLSEPVIWDLEIHRAVHEQSALAARTEGLIAVERRTWHLANVATVLAINADGERVDALRRLGQRLVERATGLLDGEEGQTRSEELAVVRQWAARLDRSNYHAIRTSQGVRVDIAIDPEVAAVLDTSNSDLRRAQEATRLLMRYPERFERHKGRQATELDQLTADLTIAQELAEHPPASVPLGRYDAPAAVAAAALEAAMSAGMEVPEDGLAWAARLLVELIEVTLGARTPDDDRTDVSFFGHGLDRAGCRALPLLALPAARRLLARLAEEGVDANRIKRVLDAIVRHGANEARLFLARAFDSLWRVPCDETEGVCPHVQGLALVEDLGRRALIGDYDPDRQRHLRLDVVDGPLAPRLAIAHERVDVPRLTPLIRGAGAAAASQACCRESAVGLLAAALHAHRTGMRTDPPAYHSADDAAAAARAVLNLAAAGNDTLLLEHLDGYADRPGLLREYLLALMAAAEETATRAAAARAVWPGLIDRVNELVASGTLPRDDRRFGYDPLTAVIPVPAPDFSYLHREFDGDPIEWVDPLALKDQVQRWVSQAAGSAHAVDTLLRLLRPLPVAEQADVGLPWVEMLVLAAPDKIASRTSRLPDWLEAVRPDAGVAELTAAWHRIVDALAVAGDDEVAALED
jgi:hypothetical protein